MLGLPLREYLGFPLFEAQEFGQDLLLALNHLVGKLLVFLLGQLARVAGNASLRDRLLCSPNLHWWTRDPGASKKLAS